MPEFCIGGAPIRDEGEFEQVLEQPPGGFEMHSAIHQAVELPATPARVYEALISSNQFGELTGAAAEIGREEGGPFSCFDGKVLGRNVELIPNRRIVQAWRLYYWDPGVYSIVRFELEGHGSETRLVFEHTGFPPEAVESLTSGWHKMYWDNLRRYLSSPAQVVS